MLADVRQYRRIDGTSLLGTEQQQAVLGWVGGSDAMQCLVTRDAWVSEYFVGNDVSRPDGEVWSGGRYRMDSGRIGAHRVG